MIKLISEKKLEQISDMMFGVGPAQRRDNVWALKRQYKAEDEELGKPIIHINRQKVVTIEDGETMVA